MSTHFNPEIYVVCLASYNAKDIHGCMIDATLSDAKIWHKIRSMLTESPYYEGRKEWLILECEGFGDINLDEHMVENGDYAPIAILARAIKKNKDLVIAARRYYRYTDPLLTALEKKYRGEWDSELDFVKDLFKRKEEERYRALEYQGYDAYCWYEPDMDRMERIKNNLFRADDLFIEAYVSLTVGNKVHVFSRD